MSLLVDCAGAPRDLGLDQGRACRAELSDRFARLPWTEALALRLGLADAPVRRLQRDVARYFPHLSETLAGLAVGARVPEAFAAREFAAELARGPAPAAAIEGQTAALVRSLEGPRVVRRSRPEGLFDSLELSRPWLPSTLLGVNERGLAVAVAESVTGSEGCAAPAALLAQDCLERFEALDAALDWCAGRPVGGRATIFLGDAAGEVAGIAIAGSERRVHRPVDGHVSRDAAGAELAKSLRDLPPRTALPPDVARVDSRDRTLSVDGVTFRL